MRQRRRLMIFSLLFGSAALYSALATPKFSPEINPAIFPLIPDQNSSLEEPPLDLHQILHEKKKQEALVTQLQKQLDELTKELVEVEGRLKSLEDGNASERGLGGQKLEPAEEAEPETEISFFYTDFQLSPYALSDPVQDFSLLSPSYTPQGLYLYERVTAGNGRGFVSEKQALGAFFAIPSTTSGDYLFLDLTGRRLTGNHYGGSYGIGCRSSYFFDNEVVGLNLFYDHAKFLNNEFQQIGVGAELISPNWEVYLNGYFPIGNKRVIENSCIYTYPEDGYRILIEEEQIAMWGMDVEFGRSLVLPLDRNRNWSLYLGAGPYFYRSTHTTCCDQSLIGGQGRLNVSVGDGANLDLIVTYDNVYKTRALLSLTMAFPFGGVDSRPLPVRRNPIPMTRHSCKYTSLGY